MVEWQQRRRRWSSVDQHVVLYARDDRQVRAILDTVGDRGVHVVRQLNSLVADAGDVALIAVSERADLSSAVVSRMRGLALPVVVVAPLTPTLLRCLERIRPVVAEVVWQEEMVQRLRRALDRAALPRALKLASENIGGGASLSPLINAALDEMCRITAPRSVAGLAERLKVSRASLYYHWTAVKPTGPSLKCFMDWCILIRAMELRRGSGKSWSMIAAQLSIHLRTLQRITRRTMGTPLGQVEGQYHEAVGRFRELMGA